MLDKGKGLGTLLSVVFLSILLESLDVLNGLLLLVLVHISGRCPKRVKTTTIVGGLSAEYQVCLVIQRLEVSVGAIGLVMLTSSLVDFLDPVLHLNESPENCTDEALSDEALELQEDDAKGSNQ